MRAVFGNTFKLVVPNMGLLFWEGMIEVNLANLSYPEHILKIVYPKEYPNRPAEAYVLKPRIYSEKHQYEDGQLCLFNPKDGEQYGWNPGRSTAVTVSTRRATRAVLAISSALAAHPSTVSNRSSHARKAFRSVTSRNARNPETRSVTPGTRTAPRRSLPRSAS